MLRYLVSFLVLSFSSLYAMEDLIHYDNVRKCYYLGDSLPQIDDSDRRKSNLEMACIDAALGHYQGMIFPISSSLPSLAKRGEKFLDTTLPTEDSSQLLAIVNALSNKYEEPNTQTQTFLGKSIRDNRTQVEDPTTHPWTGVVYLSLIFKTIDNNQKEHTTCFSGSGFLRKDGSVVTAAHNLYDHASGLFVTEVRAYPGREEEGGRWEGIQTKYFIHPKYIEAKAIDTKYDIAAIDFKHAFQKDIDDKFLSFFEPQYIPLESLQKQELHLTGFPGVVCTPEGLKNLQSRIMMTGTGKIISQSTEGGTLQYDMVTTPGNSGSPVYFTEDDRQICCGIHSDAGEGNFNIGVHMTSEILGFIEQSIQKIEE